MKIYTLKELREQSYQHGFDPLPEPERKVIWWQRLWGWIWPDRQKLLDANAKLRSELLAAKLACEQAGKHGLQLYAENEALRENAANVLEQGEARDRIEQRKYELEKENIDLKRKLDRAYADHDRLYQDVTQWINQFQK